MGIETTSESGSLVSALLGASPKWRSAAPALAQTRAHATTQPQNTQPPTGHDGPLVAVDRHPKKVAAKEATLTGSAAFRCG